MAEAKAEEKKGKTNMVRLRNTAPDDGRQVYRPRTTERTDGQLVSKMIKSNPGKAAWYDGTKLAVQLYALGNPNGNPPVKPYLEPASPEAREWLKEVRADHDRIQAELAEE